MSSRAFSTPQHDVLVGWDAMQDAFFLVVEERGSLADEPLYSNLSDPDAQHGALRAGLTLPQVFDRLKQLGLSAPDELRADLQEDEAGRRMDVEHRYH